MSVFPIGLMLVLRFFKLAAVLALATGTFGAFFARAYEDRQRFAYALAGPGFGITWTLGFVLAYGSGVSLLAPWILLAGLASMISINVVLWGVGVDGRNGRGAASLATVLLLVTLAMMVWKPTF